MIVVVCVVVGLGLPLLCFFYRGCLWYELRKEAEVRGLLRAARLDAKHPEEAARRRAAAAQRKAAQRSSDDEEADVEMQPPARAAAKAAAPDAAAPAKGGFLARLRGGKSSSPKVAATPIGTDAGAAGDYSDVRGRGPPWVLA